MHGVIAEEEGIFSIEDVVTGITEKMIHRHPHVFSKEEWEKQDRKKTWEELKAEEAGHAKEKILPLHSVPKALPALLRMCKVLKKADTAYQKRTSREESLEEISKLPEGAKSHLSCWLFPWGSEFLGVAVSSHLSLSLLMSGVTSPETGSWLLDSTC